jgi:hypothetical protein
LDHKTKPSEDKIKHLAQALHVEDFVATLLVQRGLKLLKTPRTSFVLSTCTILPDEETWIRQWHD